MDELSDSETAPYDMIIGIDLLTTLEMNLKISHQTIVWDNLTAPMQTRKDQDKGGWQQLIATYSWELVFLIIKHTIVMNHST